MIVKVLRTISCFLLILFTFNTLSQTSAPLAVLPIIVDFSDFTGANMSSAYPGWNEGDGNPPTPLIGESGWYSSDVMYNRAVAVSLNSNTHKEWVITPSFQATANSKITFDAAVTLLYNDPAPGFMDTDDSVAIMVSTNGLDFYSVFAIDQDNQPAQEMLQFDVPLGEFAGEEISVAFYGTDGNIDAGQCAFHFDNVVIKNDPPHDAKAFDLVSPNPGQCYSAAEPVIVNIKNDGQQTLYSVPVRVKVRGQVVQNLYAVFNDYIEPGDTAVFLVDYLDMSEPGIYELTIQTELPGDGFLLNNRKTDTIHHQPVFDKPLGPLDFTDYYDENLSEIYPGWFEARGVGIPMVMMDTDWQANNNLGNRTANVYYTFTYTYDWIVGPKFVVNENTKLKFDAAIEYEIGTQMGSDDKLSVMVSSNCGESWEEVYVIDQSTLILPMFINHSVDLSAYNGEQLIIAFYAHTGTVSDPEKFFIHIDNVHINDFYPADAGITALLQPLNPCSFSSDETIEITVKNFGESAISGFNVSYAVNGGTPVTESVTATISSGNTLDFIFAQSADLTGAQEHLIETWSDLPGDGDNSNDTLLTIVSTSSFNLISEGAYTMGFEPNEDYGDWLVEDGNGDDFVWALNTEGQHAHNGVQSFWYSSNNSSSPSNDWLISPCFNLEAGSTYNVAFFYKNRASLYPEKLKLNLGTAQSGNTMSQLIIDLGEIDNGNYLLSETEFTVPVSGSYYFGWHAYGDADQFGCHVDDVEIRQIFNHDLAVEKVNVQRSYLPGSCEIADADTVTLTVKNVGEQVENTIPVALMINNGSPVTKTFSETLLPGESIDLVMDENITIPASTSVDIVAWTASPDDLNTANDTMSLENFLLNDLYMDFESSEDFSNWTQQSLLGNTTWELINDADLSFSGDYCYGIRTDQGANNDYLYSSCIHLEANACYTLSFFYRSRFSTEYMEVFLATDPVNTAVIDTLTELNGFNSNAYLSEETVFNVETTGDYYLAWHTQGGQSGRYWIYVDKIAMYENDLGPEATIDFTILDREVAFTATVENTTDMLWDFGDGTTSSAQNPDHVYFEEGNYTVTFTASNNCNAIELTEEVEIICPVEAAFTYSMPVSPNVVEFETTSEAAGYLWDFDTGDLAFIQNPTYTYEEIGDYEVMLRTMNACGVDSTSQVVQILTIGMTENTGDKGFVTLYPNPTDGKIWIDNLANRDLRITITGLKGSTILTTSIKSGSPDILLDLSNFDPGIYFVEVDTGVQVYRKKIIKQ